MTSSKQIDLDYFIVAFVDILGFSNMVKSDCENKSDSIKYFEVLREINKETQKLEIAISLNFLTLLFSPYPYRKTII